jgi:SAM-dependent methyltransferase
MMLRRLLKEMKRTREPDAPRLAADPTRASLLNVGGGSKAFGIPAHYAGWQHVLLDIDPKGGADIVLDARGLEQLPAAQFDAVYCSHNLEHYHHHEVPRVLAGFRHVLKPHGFAEIRVPDLEAVFRAIVVDGRGLDAQLQIHPRGPVTARDIIYGWTIEIEQSGTDFYAHKTGFTSRTLSDTLRGAGFEEVWKAPTVHGYELRAVAFKQPATPEQRLLLGIPGA